MTSNSSTAPKRDLRWRVVDIVVASVIGVTAGVVFLVWNIASSPATAPLEAALPGLQALGHGVWLFAGVLTALVIRKPGAAIYGETLAAVVSALIGNQWGPLTIVQGLVQGLGAELVFAIFLYVNWRLGAAVLAGAGAGIAMVAFDLVVWYPGADVTFATVYAASGIVSGAVIAGVLSWLLVRGLAKTGVLSRFASGRDVTARV